MMEEPDILKIRDLMGRSTRAIVASENKVKLTCETLFAKKRYKTYFSLYYNNEPLITTNNLIHAVNSYNAAIVAQYALF